MPDRNRDGRPAPLDRLSAVLWILFPPLVLAGLTAGEICAGALGLLWIVRRLRGGPAPSPWPAGFALPLGCFYAWLFAAAFATGAGPGDLRDLVAKWWFVLLLPLAFAERPDALQARRALLALLAGAVLLLPYMLWSLERTGYGRAQAFSGGAPNLGSNLMYGTVIFAVLALEASGAVRAGLATAAAALLGGVALTLNRGALLGAAVGAGWPVARRRPTLLAVALLAVSFGAALFPAATPVLRLRSILILKDSESSRERLAMWQAGLAMIRDRPLAGLTSRRAFIAAYPAYKLPAALEVAPGHVHNSVLQTAILHGVPGLGLLLWWLAVLARHAWRRLRPRPGAAPESRALAAAVAPLFVAAAVNAQVDFILADGQRAMLLYGLAGLLLGATAEGVSPRRSARRVRAAR